MRPIIPSTILKGSSANFARNNPPTQNNRYSALRDLSPSDARSRSPSVKRKAIDNTYANAAKKSLTVSNSAPGFVGIRVSPPTPVAAISAENLEIIEVNSAKVASICEKLHESILAIPEENPVCPILRDFCSLFHIQSENTKIIVEALRKVVIPVNSVSEHDTAGAYTAHGVSDSEMESDSEPYSQMVSLGALPKARNSLLPSQQRGRQPRGWAPANDTAHATRTDTSPAPPPLDPGVQKFRDLVQNAEKSTVIFNLDMGRVPVINRNTMCVKATAALASMAAAVEERPANNPSRDTVDAIDDAISVADNVSFFGSTTKSVTGIGEKNGSYCTIPVCYSFPDRETRIKAEQVLRARCKASCATPYPQSLRNCMKQVLESGRKARPADFCSVSFDLPKLSLRVSWRARGSSVWTRHESLIPLPEDAIMNPSRVPEGGYTIPNLPIEAGNVQPLSHPPPLTSTVRPLTVRNSTNFFDTVDSASATPTPP